MRCLNLALTLYIVCRDIKEQSSWRSTSEAPVRDSDAGKLGGTWKPSEKSTVGGWRSRVKAREESWKSSSQENSNSDDHKPVSRLGMPRDIRLDDPSDDRFKDKCEYGDSGSWRRGSSFRDQESATVERDGGRRDDGVYGNRGNYGRRDDDRSGYGRRRDDDGGGLSWRLNDPQDKREENWSRDAPK